MEPKPASVGKTVAIAGSIPLAFQDLLFEVMHDVYLYSWFSAKMAANITVLAVAIAAVIMHRNQRKKENEEINGVGSSGSGA